MTAIPKPVKGLRRKVKKATRLLCDRIAGAAVRGRRRCEGKGAEMVDEEGRKYKLRCKGPLQWCHIISRSYSKIRWFFGNALCLCASHHSYWTWRPVEWRAFINAKLGAGRYEELQDMAIGPIWRVGSVDEYTAFKEKPTYEEVAKVLR